MNAHYLWPTSRKVNGVMHCEVPPARSALKVLCLIICILLLSAPSADPSSCVFRADFCAPPTSSSSSVCVSIECRPSCNIRAPSSVTDAILLIHLCAHHNQSCPALLFLSSSSSPAAVHWSHGGCSTDVNYECSPVCVMSTRYRVAHGCTVVATLSKLPRPRGCTLPVFDAMTITIVQLSVCVALWSSFSRTCNLLKDNCALQTSDEPSLLCERCVSSANSIAPSRVGHQRCAAAVSDPSQTMSVTDVITDTEHPPSVTTSSRSWQHANVRASTGRCVCGIARECHGRRCISQSRIHDVL